MAPKSIPGTGAKSYIDPVSDHGAAGNAKSNLNVTIAAGSLDTVTLGAGDQFASGDSGKTIGISYAGVIDATKTVAKTHVATLTYVNSTTATISPPALHAVSPATHPNGEGWSFAAWGADDTTPLRNALAAASSARKPIRLGKRKYLTTGELTWPDYCAMIGEGRYASVLYPVGSDNFSCIRYDGSGGAAPPVLAPVLRDFEIDGHGLTNSTYTTITKGIYIVHFREALFENMYVHHTPATAFGCDHPIDSEWRNCWADYGGRQVAELSGGAGGSGLGIGCGKNEYENLLVAGGGAKNCGKYGLFIENQTTSNPLPKGYRVDGFVADSNQYGISENGTQGAIFDSCQALRNTVAGFRVTKAFTDRYGRDSRFSDCVAMFNAMGYDINTGDGQVTIDGGIIAFNTGDGIEINDTGTGSGAAPDPTGFRIRDVDIYNNTGRGVRVMGSTSTFDRITIRGGAIFNNGLNNATQRAGIAIERPVSRLEVTGVRGFDDRAAGAKTQSYGLEILAGVTVAELLDIDNDFPTTGTNALGTGARNLAGTVTTSRTRALP